ncbi:MAG: NUDIX domain-containing protein, partial [Pseudomonadales bacterium]|nr:NUDIX domain-containing protein [Pseudomonadales bacterium]
MVDRIHVVAGIIFSDDEQQVLLSKRHKDAHQGGLWEFPGGKVEPAESESQALARELREELNLVFANATPFHRLNFDYPDKSVELSFWSV